jgi:hypothetical protein
MTGATGNPRSKSQYARSRYREIQNTNLPKTFFSVGLVLVRPYLNY